MIIDEQRLLDDSNNTCKHEKSTCKIKHTGQWRKRKNLTCTVEETD